MTECERKEYILSLSYGKDSLACLGAIERLKWPLDRIVHAEVWATDTISADLPPMVEFKKRPIQSLNRGMGLKLSTCAQSRKKEGDRHLKINFINRAQKGNPSGLFTASPWCEAPWCNSGLKRRALRQCFPKAPLHKEQVQILCNISGLPRMNLPV